MQAPKKENAVVGKTKKVVLVYLLSFLTGCTSMNSGFDCPNKPGVSCRSLDQVNDMVDQGVVGRDGGYKKSKTPDKPYVFKTNSNFASPIGVVNSIQPPRAGEQLARIWIAPYQDIYGNYHNEEVIHAVVQKNHWAVPVEIIGAKETKGRT